MFVSAESGIFTGKKLPIRIGKSPKGQRDLFRPVSEDFIDINHELILSANKTDWSYFGKEPSVCCSDKGAPSVPIRMPVGCMLLKHLYDLEDERLPEYQVRDVCFRYFRDCVFLSTSFRLIRAILSIYAIESERMDQGRFLPLVSKFTGKRQRRNQNIGIV